jgi:hypothetical protein
LPPNASSNDDLYNNQSPRPHLAGESNCEQNGEPGLQAAKQWAAAVLDAGGAGSSPGQKVLFVLDKELLELGVFTRRKCGSVSRHSFSRCYRTRSNLAWLRRSRIFIDTMTKTRPAPLGATYKRNVRLGWSDPRSDVAPSEAKRALFNLAIKILLPRSYVAAP